MDDKTSPRYPYTYAVDYIRMLAGYNEKDLFNGTKLSRADASKILHNIARIIGMSDEELAKKLADEYLDKQDDLTEKAVEIIVKNLTEI